MITAIALMIGFYILYQALLTLTEGPGHQQSKAARIVEITASIVLAMGVSFLLAIVYYIDVHLQ